MDQPGTTRCLSLMMLATTTLACAPPEDAWTSAAAQSGAELVPRPGERGWELDLVNAGELSITVPRDDWDEPARVRYEALQPDGSWVVREPTGRDWRSGPTDTVQPGETEALARIREVRLAEAMDRPGTYRVVVSTDRGELSREYVIFGWGEDALYAALDLRARAAATGCHSVGRLLDMDLLARLEPDALTELHARTEGWRRDDVRLEMLRRGSFVELLEDVLVMAELRDVRTLVDHMGWRSGVQPSLRRAAAARLSARLAGTEPVSASDYDRLHELGDALPPGTLTRLVDRLESGPESGGSLRGLIELLTRRDDEELAPLSERILAALPARCEGTLDPCLESACSNLEATLSDTWDYGWPLHGTGRRASGSTSCGIAEPAECEAFHHEHQALVERLGEVHELWL